MIDSFFAHLSSRLYSENNLSDVTWALCQASNAFKQYFLNYIFDNTVDYNEPFDIIREYSESNTGRPDLFFQCGEQSKYIIEVKIYDKNDHFDQYKKDFPKATFGFIANYEMESRNDIYIKTWESFHDYLTEIIKSDMIDSDEITLIEGYLVYLKEVCAIMEIKKLNFANISSLYYFTHIIEKIIKSEKNCDIYNRMTSRSSDEYSGKYFSYKSTTLKKTIYPWFGIFHSSYDENIYISFSEDDNCRLFTEKYSRQPYSDGKYYDKPYLENKTLWFGMKKNYYEKLCTDEVSIENKIDILKSFYKDIIAEIKKTID